MKSSSKLSRARSLSALAGSTGMEPLEARALLAAVSWDGGAGDNLWNSPANWSTDAVPGPADDVTIDVAGSPLIRFTNVDRTINSLVTREALQIENHVLTITTTAVADGAAVTMAGGTLAGGSWSYLNGGSLALTSSGGVLRNVAANTDLLLNASSKYIVLEGTTSFTAARLSATSTSLYLTPGYTLNSLVSIEGAATGGRSIIMAYGGAGNATIGPSGIVRLAASSGGALSMQNSSTSTLVNNGLIVNESTQTLTIQNSTFNNNANVQALAGTINVTPTTMTASATSAFSVATGATLSLDGTSWSNAGTIAVNGGTLNLDGAFTTAGLNIPGFSRTGGTVFLKGTLTNTAATLALNSATGSWVMSGGEIIGGSVTYAGGASLLTSSGGGTLTNVAVAGELVATATSSYYVVSGTTTFTAVRLQGNNTNLYVTPGSTINNLVSIEGAAAGTRSVILAYGGSGTVTLGPSGVIRLAAGSGGAATIQNSSTSTLVNNGLIVNESTQTLTIQNSTFNNNANVQALVGTLNVSPTAMTGGATAAFSVASGATLTLEATNWSNAGSITVNSGTLNLGGTFTTAGFNFPGFSRTGGTVFLKGTLTNTAATLALNAATGSWIMSGGTINGGSVTFAGGALLSANSSGGTFNNVAVAGELLANTTSAYFVVSGTTTFTAVRLQANNANLYMVPGYTLNNLVSIEGAATGTRSVILAYGGVGTVTFGASAVVRLAAGSGGSATIQNSSTATLVNNGLITAEAAGLSLTISNSTFTNNASGVVQALAGTLRVNSPSYTNAGTFSVATGATLELDGTFNTTGGSGTFTNAGTGLVRVTGTITNTGNTITLNTTTGPWTMAGGAINNGSMTLTGVSLLTTTSGGTLNNLAINGEILANTTSGYFVLSGSTSFSAARLTANGSTLYMAPGYTLNNLVSAEGAATGNRSIIVAYGGAGTVTFGASAIARVAAGSGGGLTITQSSTGTLANNGLIVNEAAGVTLTVQPSTFNNLATGVVRATAGTVTLNATTYTNAGTFRVGNGAVLNLDGGFNATTGVGTLINDGTGVINVTGTITNTGNTITTNAATGSLTMRGGAIVNGSLLLTAGTNLLTTSSGGTISSLAITGEVLLNTTSAYLVHAGTSTYTAMRLTANSTQLYVAPGATLASLISAEGAATGTRVVTIAYGGTGTATIAPTGIIRLAAGAGGGLTINQSSSGTLVNTGLISAEAAGETLLIQPAALNNQAAGMIQALAGTLRINATSYTNAGTLKVVSGAVLELDGGFNATGGVGTLSNTGGGVTNITGAVTNTAGTITLNASTGPWTMRGGSITGGSLVLSGGTNLLTTSTGGTLTNLAVTGEILLSTTSAYIVLAGNTSFSAARMQANSTNIYMAPGYTLNSPIFVEGAATGTRTITIAYGGAGTVTFGSSAAVRISAGSGGGLTINQSSAGTLANNGLIANEAAGTILTIQPGAVNNLATGVIHAVAGTVTINATNWTNAGTVRVGNGATVNVDGGFNATGGIGTFLNDGTGLTRVAGAVTNTGNTITLNTATGSWTMAGGSITGGTLTLTAGSALLATSSGGTLANLTVNGDLTASASSSYFVLSGTTTFGVARLIGSGASIYMAPGYTLNNTIQAEGAATGTRAIYLAYGGNGTHTFAPSALVRIASGSGGGLNLSQSSTATLVNNGVIQGLQNGVSLTIQPNTFTNNGTVDGAGSNVILSATNLPNFAGNALNGGVWKASAGGSLAGGAAALIKVINVSVVLDGANKGWDALAKLESVPVGITFQLTGGTDQAVAPAVGTFTNSGTLILGLGSKLTITGNFVQAATGTLESRIAGGNVNTNYGSLTATGTGSLAGSLNIVAVNGYEPSRPDVQDVVKTTGSTTGTFASVTYPQTTNPDWHTYFIYTGNGAQLLTTSIIDFNVDGEVDLSDYFIFFNYWDISDPAVDLNTDGSVDLGDYFLFFNLWDQG